MDQSFRNTLEYLNRKLSWNLSKFKIDKYLIKSLKFV